MKVLQLCIRVPYPPIDGGSIAMYTMQQALVENGVELKVLSFNTIKQYVDFNKLPDEYKAMTSIEGIYLDNRIKPFGAFFNLFTGESYHIIRFIRRDFEEALQKILAENKFDIIQMESLYMVPYLQTIKAMSDAKVVLRTHNLEYLIWERLANTETKKLKKWYLQLLSKRLRSYEFWALQSVDCIVALTKEDHNQMLAAGIKTKSYIAPIGINLEKYKVVAPPIKKIIFHLGAMDWLPNQEGIHWFLKEVWPVIKSKYPDVYFHFAGKKMPEEFKAYQDERCKVEEFVPDSIAYMQQGTLMIVPLFSGSGMRVKIVEGMALGKAIVSTSVGVEGIPAMHRENCMIANTKEEFIASIEELFTNETLHISIGMEARKTAEREFDNQIIGRNLVEFYEELANG